MSNPRAAAQERKMKTRVAADTMKIGEGDETQRTAAADESHLDRPRVHLRATSLVAVPAQVALKFLGAVFLRVVGTLR